MASTTKSTAINIRIDNRDLEVLKERAASEAIGYQALLRRVVTAWCASPASSIASSPVERVSTAVETSALHPVSAPVDEERIREIVREETPAVDQDNRLVPIPRAGWRPPPRLALFSLGALTGKFAQHTSFDQMVASAAKAFRRHAVRDVLGDPTWRMRLNPSSRSTASAT